MSTFARFRPFLTPYLGRMVLATVLGMDVAAINRALLRLAGTLWDVITAVLAERAPGAKLVPKMLAGATDAKHVARLGTRVYGFCPELYIAPDEGNRIHGHDERMSVASIRWGVRTLFEVVRRFCGGQS